MATTQTRNAARPRRPRHRRELIVLALLVPAASCVPDAPRLRSAGSLAALSPEEATNLPVPALTLAPVAAAVPALPVDSGAAAASVTFTPQTNVDGMRALDCLAQAVYYEARSETEGGQRAVAQVVLNRVRHPAYPGSVCGVVYQGPMKAGGGCQFTFTCDGSLARRPVEPGWSRARRIAEEALAGQVYAPVGLATHYHTFQVAPAWAPALTRTAVIGSHIFYRWTGRAGTASAFGQTYAGREPGRPLESHAVAATSSAAPDTVRLAYAPSIALPIADWVPDRLPQSQVRPEYENSGAWRTD